MTRFRRTLFGVTAMVAVAATSWLDARQDPQRPVFRAEVNLLRVDVQVVADDGQPIPNLEIADFKVAIDGQPRRIVSAELVEYSQRSPDAVAPVVPIRTPGRIPEDSRAASFSL